MSVIDEEKKGFFTNVVVVEMINKVVTHYNKALNGCQYVVVGIPHIDTVFYHYIETFQNYSQDWEETVFGDP